MREGRLTDRQAQHAAGQDDRRGRPSWCWRTTGCRRWRCRSPRAGGAQALPGYVRTIEMLEASGRLDRKVEGLAIERGAAPPRAGGSRADPARARGRAVDVQDGAAGRGRGAEAGRRPADRAAAVRGLPQADAQGACRRDPRPPAAPRDHRDQGRQPVRQPPRPERRARPDRGGRRVARPGRSPPSWSPSGCSTSTNCGREIEERHAARSGAHRAVRDRRGERPRRICPTSSARPAARPASAACARCSSPACARSPRRRPS